MPDVADAIARLIQINWPRGCGVFRMVEEFQACTVGVAAENGEVNSLVAFVLAQRHGRASTDVSVLGNL